MIDGREDEMSRCLARFFCDGEDRLFSGICFERRFTSLKWFALWLIVDDHFRRRRGESHHCRHAYHRERIEAMASDDRARWAGL